MNFAMVASGVEALLGSERRLVRPYDVSATRFSTRQAGTDVLDGRVGMGWRVRVRHR
jgi:hypothetical protein